jgi:predicted  nucleic acid-binding Zn-ribbon protein
MAKKHDTEPQDSEFTNAVVITVESADPNIAPSRLQDYLLTTEQVIDEAKNLMIIESIGSQEKLEQIIESYSGIVISGIEDMQGYKFLDSAIKEVKKYRTTLEKKRKELTAPALKFQSALIEAQNLIEPRLKQLEEKLKAEKTRIDDAKEAAKKQLYTDRVKLLSGAGYELANGFFICGAFQVASTDIVDLDDNGIQFYVTEGTKELARREAEKQRKIEAEQELQRMRDELAAERKQMAAEMEAIRKEREELAAQKIAMEQTYENVAEINHQGPMGEPVVVMPEPNIQNNVPVDQVAPVTEQPHPITSNPTIVTNTPQPSATQPIATQQFVTPEQQSILNTSDKIRLHNASFIEGFEFGKTQIIGIITNVPFKTKRELVDLINNLTTNNNA